MVDWWFAELRVFYVSFYANHHVSPDAQSLDAVFQEMVLND
jgi:hypothetical protein